MTNASDLIPLDDLDFYLNDPLPTFARMRRECPVYWYEPGDYYVLTRHDDIANALRTPELFSSAEGILRRSAGSEIMNQLTKGTIASSDPPLHTKLRRKVNRGFSGRAINNMEPLVRSTVEAIVDRLESGQVYDFVHDIAEDVPVTILGHLCGIPPEDHKPIVGLVDKTVLEFATSGEAVTESVFELLQYMMSFVQSRLDDPGDDLISKITAPDEDGERLSLEDVFKFLLMVISAGSETTRGLLSRGVYDLGRFPDQRERLMADPALLPSAIEEMFRFASPAASLARVTTQPVTIGDALIPADKLVLLMLASANFDEDVFGPDAGEFRIDRNPNPHLGLGLGPHFCLGGGLARLEARVFLEELFRRFSHWTLPEPPTPYPAFEFYRSFVKMPIFFELSNR